MKKKSEKFPELMQWFDFMNDQFKKIEECDQKSKINKLLDDNDIDIIE